MKRLCILTALICALGLSYFLFRNVIEYSFGWKEAPIDLVNYSFEGEEGADFADEIVEARIELRELYKVSKAPAASIAISIGGEIVWSEALGLRDIEAQISADTSTQFRIGSTSKALTSLGLGKLLEEGVIHLDSSIQFYTSHFSRQPRIKIRQLASHQSGIRNYGVCLCLPIWEYYRDTYFFSVEESLKDFEYDPLLFEPGDDFAYSSYNFTSLSHAMEKAARTDFLSLMERRVFKELGMRSTQANFKHLNAANQSVFYDIRDNEYKVAPEVNLSNKWAGGGFLSTPSDLVRAGNALLSEDFLSAGTVQKLIEPQQLNDGTVNEQNYALGWRHSRSKRFLEGKKEIETINHGGMAVGSQSLLIVFPEYDMVVSLLMNKGGQEGRFELFSYLTPIVNIFLKKLEIEN